MLLHRVHLACREDIVDERDVLVPELATIHRMTRMRGN